MKTATIWFLSLAFAFALYPGISLISGNIATSAAAAADNAQPSGTLLADNVVIYTKRTCSGALASERPNLFMFGLSNTETGKCMTRRYLANNEDEAMLCAKKSCPDCQIQEITWMYGFSSSAPGVSDTDRYCPERKK